MINRQEKYKNLKSIEYRISEDSLGKTLTIKIEHFEEYDFLIKEERLSHNGELIKEEYKLSNDTLEKFKVVLGKYKYENWEYLETSKEFIYDAGIAKITFYFEENKLYTIDEYKILPKKENDLFKKIYDFLNETIKK